MRELLVNNAVIISPSYTRSNSTDETYCVKGDTPNIRKYTPAASTVVAGIKAETGAERFIAIHT